MTRDLWSSVIRGSLGMPCSPGLGLERLRVLDELFLSSVEVAIGVPLRV